MTKAIAAILILVSEWAAAQSLDAHWLGSWSASPMPISAKDNAVQAAADTTYRNVIRMGLGGDTVRVQLTNEFGEVSLEVDGAHVALSASKGAIQPRADRPLTFGGRSSVLIPAGAYVVSDPVRLHVAPLSSLVVSIYIAHQDLAIQTCHDLASSTNYLFRGRQTSTISPESAQRYNSWCYLKGVEVQADRKAAVIVALGDSITDGAESTTDANRRWTDRLTEKLSRDPRTSMLAVLNQGIDGNQLLRDESGQSALGRVDRDVLGQSGVKYLILLEGTNDIGRSVKLKKPGEAISVEDLTFAASQIVRRAHAHGVKVIGGTLLPYRGAKYFSTQGNATRRAYNRWIKTSGVFDAVIDFEQALRDPAHPDAILPSYDSGDHLHPNDAGYAAMADAIDLSIFR
jgi:lysophospholipase L1-like esterase